MMQYRIHVRGQLDSAWQEWFVPLELSHDAAGTTTLSGPLPDQAALFGVLLKLQRLGITLLALESNEAPADTGSGEASSERTGA